jgi:hypothetical protein
MVAITFFEGGSVERGKKEEGNWGPAGAAMWRRKRGGAGVAVGSAGRSVMAPDRLARAAVLPCE